MQKFTQISRYFWQFLTLWKYCNKKLQQQKTREVFIWFSQNLLIYGNFLTVLRFFHRHFSSESASKQLNAKLKLFWCWCILKFRTVYGKKSVDRIGTKSMSKICNLWRSIVVDCDYTESYGQFLFGGNADASHAVYIVPGDSWYSGLALSFGIEPKSLTVEE